MKSVLFHFDLFFYFCVFEICSKFAEKYMQKIYFFTYNQEDVVTVVKLKSKSYHYM